MNNNDFQNILKARAGVYEYLYTAFYKVPDSDFIKYTMIFAEILSNMLTDNDNKQLKSCVDDFNEYLSCRTSVKPDEELLGINAVFTGLFLMGSDKLNFFESYWRRVKASKTDIIIDLAKYFSDNNIIKPTVINLPPESFSMELFFMYKMAQKTIESSDEDILKLLATQQNFLKAHLLDWSDDFCDEVVSKCGKGTFSKLYSGIAKATKWYIKYDFDFLTSIH